jgi:hypothetical protein
MKIVSFQMVEVCSELDIVSGKATGTTLIAVPGKPARFQFSSIYLFLYARPHSRKIRALAEPHPWDLEGWRYR